MIIDTNVNLSRWPFRRLPCDETPALIKRLKKWNVNQAWAGSLDGIFHRDVGGVNLRLFEECQEHKEILLPFGTVNPALPDWQEDLRRCREDYRMPGIRLHPNYHGYRLDDPRCIKLLELARDAKLLVQLAVRMDDTRVQHPLMQVEDVDLNPLPAVVQSVPDLRLMLLNSLGILRQPLLGKILKAGKVHVEISMLEGLGGIAQLLKTIPLDRLHFGSHLPLFVLESAIFKLQESPLSETQLTAIQSGNAKKLLNR